MFSRTRLLLLGYGAATAGTVGAMGLSALSLGLPAACLLGLLTDGVARPNSSVFYPTISHGSRSLDRVALSFDDGPDPEVTPALLDVLSQHGAHATFFAIGRRLEEEPRLARRIAAEGHELGNHSWCHSRWQNFRGAAAQAREIARGARSIATVTGAMTRPLYRPPIGLKSPQLARAADQARLTVVGWSLRSFDTHTNDPEPIAARVLRRIRPGDIVLLHDGHDRPGHHRPACVGAATLILEGLRRKGLECTTVSALLHPGNEAARRATAAKRTA